MSVIRKADYKEYVLMQKTIDDLYPTLPVTAGSLGVGLFTQLRTLATLDSDWRKKFDAGLLDTSFCLNYGDRWLNPRGSVGLNFNATTKAFSNPTYTTLNDLAKLIEIEYNPKWQKLYELMVSDYNPLDNWDGTEDHDGDWTKNGTKSTVNTTAFQGGESTSHDYQIDPDDPLKEVTKYTDSDENIDDERTVRDYTVGGTDNPYKETKHGGKSITSSQPTSITRSYGGEEGEDYKETTATVAMGGSVDETLISGFNSGNSGTHPADVEILSTTGHKGELDVDGTDYVPKQLEKHSTSDGTQEKKIEGSYTDEIEIGVGSETYINDDSTTTYDGIEGKYGDIKTGGHSVTNKGHYTETKTTNYTVTDSEAGTVDRKNVFNGSQLYDLDGTDDKTVTYTGFMDRTGRGTRQALGEQEWEFRKHLFIETVMKDVADYISLKIY